MWAVFMFSVYSLLKMNCIHSSVFAFKQKWGHYIDTVLPKNKPFP